MRSGAKLISSQFSKSFFDDITPDGVNVPAATAAAELNLTQWLTLHYTNQSRPHTVESRENIEMKYEWSQKISNVF